MYAHPADHRAPIQTAMQPSVKSAKGLSGPTLATLDFTTLSNTGVQHALTSETYYAAVTGVCFIEMTSFELAGTEH